MFFGLGKLTFVALGVFCGISITGGGFSPNEAGCDPRIFPGLRTIKMRWDFPARHHRSQGTRPPKLAILQGVPPLPVMGSHWGAPRVGGYSCFILRPSTPPGFRKVHGENHLRSFLGPPEMTSGKSSEPLNRSPSWLQLRAVNLRPSKKGCFENSSIL